MVETRGSEGQGAPQLHSEFQASLSSVRLCLEKEEGEKEP